MSFKKCLSNVFFIFSLSIFFQLTVFAATSTYEIEKNLVESDKKISRLVKKVLELTSIYPESNALSEVIPLINGEINPEFSWMRKNNIERWEIQKNKNIKDENLDEIIKIINDDIGLGSEVAPRINENHGILFLGAALSRVRARLHYLNENIEKKNILPTTIYLIGGERILSKQIGESMENLYNSENGQVTFRNDYKVPENPVVINDERDMMKLVFSQSLHPLLDNKVALAFSSKAPNEKRATTKSTLESFINDYYWNLKKGKYVVISNQPYVLYQKKVFQNICKNIENRCNGIEFEFIGASLNEHYDSIEDKRKYVARLLDILGQTLVQLSQN